MVRQQRKFLSLDLTAKHQICIFLPENFYEKELY